MKLIVIIKTVFIVGVLYLLTGCAPTLHFLFDVDENLYYNDQEKKWEVRK